MLGISARPLRRLIAPASAWVAGDGAAAFYGLSVLPLHRPAGLIVRISRRKAEGLAA